MKRDKEAALRSIKPLGTDEYYYPPNGRNRVRIVFSTDNRQKSTRYGSYIEVLYGNEWTADLRTILEYGNLREARKCVRQQYQEIDRDLAGEFSKGSNSPLNIPDDKLMN